MGLVDAGEVDLWEILKIVDEVSLQALRSQKQQIDLALFDHVDDLLFVLSVDERTDAGCRQILGQMGQLVQHERDQRTDDYRQSSLQH